MVRVIWYLPPARPKFWKVRKIYAWFSRILTKILNSTFFTDFKNFRKWGLAHSYLVQHRYLPICQDHPRSIFLNEDIFDWGASRIPHLKPNVLLLYKLITIIWFRWVLKKLIQDRMIKNIYHHCPQIHGPMAHTSHYRMYKHSTILKINK